MLRMNQTQILLNVPVLMSRKHSTLHLLDSDHEEDSKIKIERPLFTLFISCIAVVFIHEYCEIERDAKNDFQTSTITFLFFKNIMVN